MKGVRITDLRREVKERLTNKGIVDLSDFKLKPININNDSEKIKSSLERNLTKIGKALTTEIVNADISVDDKIAKINQLLEGEIKVKVSETDSSLVKKLVKTFSKGKEIEEICLEIVVEEGNVSQHTYSALNYEPTKRQEGYFSFRFQNSDSIPFAGFNKLIGTLYFYNKLREYIRTNKEMSILVFIKYIHMNGIYKNKEQKARMDELANEYNLPSSGYVCNYISEFSSRQVKLLQQTRYYEYLDWIDNGLFFNLSSIFDINCTLDRYLLYSIKNPKLTSHYLNHLYDLNSEEEYDVKEEQNISADYAKSYETKKNIPQKVLDKMEITKFKSHFGYVEFDELVDLDKVEIMESEWETINKKILMPLAKDHSLRFRRLGKHKAAGLYFSGMKAVCVDLESPYSMIHEILHMIDYTTLPNTTLSSMFNFRGIIERYRDVTNRKVEALDENNGFRSLWNGKTKYNKDYYHSSKEIFARCGEIFVHKILRIESSLVKAENQMLYPTDDEFLLELITKYYSSIIQLAPEQKEEYKIVSSPGVMSKEEVANILQRYQLNMFDMIGVS